MTVEVKVKGAADSTYVDITDLIANKGVKWSDNSVDADGAGRNLLGTMIRMQIAIKEKIEIQCRPMTSTEYKNLRTLMRNAWLTVRFTDNAETIVFDGYRGATLSAAALVTYGNRDLWGDCRIAFIEE